MEMGLSGYLLPTLMPSPAVLPPALTGKNKRSRSGNEILEHGGRDVILGSEDANPESKESPSRGGIQKAKRQFQMGVRRGRNAAVERSQEKRSRKSIIKTISELLELWRWDLGCARQVEMDWLGGGQWRQFEFGRSPGPHINGL